MHVCVCGGDGYCCLREETCLIPFWYGRNLLKTKFQLTRTVWTWNCTCSTVNSAFVRSCVLTRWGTADAEIKAPFWGRIQSTAKIPSFNRDMGRIITFTCFPCVMSGSLPFYLPSSFNCIFPNLLRTWSDNVLSTMTQTLTLTLWLRIF